MSIIRDNHTTKQCVDQISEHKHDTSYFIPESNCFFNMFPGVHTSTKNLRDVLIHVQEEGCGTSPCLTSGHGFDDWVEHYLDMDSITGSNMTGLDLVQRLEFGVDHLQKNAVYQIE